jgi:hypothetical protein
MASLASSLKLTPAQPLNKLTVIRAKIPDLVEVIAYVNHLADVPVALMLNAFPVCDEVSDANGDYRRTQGQKPPILYKEQRVHTITLLRSQP